MNWVTQISNLKVWNRGWSTVFSEKAKQSVQVLLWMGDQKPWQEIKKCEGASCQDMDNILRTTRKHVMQLHAKARKAQDRITVMLWRKLSGKIQCFMSSSQRTTLVKSIWGEKTWTHALSVRKAVKQTKWAPYGQMENY